MIGPYLISCYEPFNSSLTEYFVRVGVACADKIVIASGTDEANCSVKTGDERFGRSQKQYAKIARMGGTRRSVNMVIYHATMWYAMLAVVEAWRTGRLRPIQELLKYVRA
jgi:hypothetical protein